MLNNTQSYHDWSKTPQPFSLDCWNLLSAPCCDLCKYTDSMDPHALLFILQHGSLEKHKACMSHWSCMRVQHIQIKTWEQIIPNKFISYVNTDNLSKEVSLEGKYMLLGSLLTLSQMLKCVWESFNQGKLFTSKLKGWLMVWKSHSSRALKVFSVLIQVHLSTFNASENPQWNEKSLNDMKRCIRCLNENIFRWSYLNRTTLSMRRNMKGLFQD